MTNDRSQFSQALQKWDWLHETERYSVPSDDGRVAILWSNYEMDDQLPEGRESEIYEWDAHEVACDLAANGIESQVFPAYTYGDAIRALRDPTITSMVTIGNGNLSEAYIASGDKAFDWRFVSRHSTHLKTGRFIMRQCGHATRSLSVPLGTFGMADHSSVYGAYNQSLPTIMSEHDNEMIQQLHTHHRLGYRAVRNLFINMFEPKPEDGSAC